MAHHTPLRPTGIRHMAGLGVCLLLVALAGCGGGSSSDAPAPGTPGTPVTPPNISTQPTAQSVVQGQAARFSVAASGGGLAYQWLRNGAAIAGAQSPSLTTPPLQAADNTSQYSVRVSNASGSTTSIPVAVRVFADTELPAPRTANLRPSATGSGIADSFGEHYVAINPAVSPNGQLFVFFPGSTAIPNNYRLIVQAAANNGFSAVGLAYPNASLVTQECSGNADPDCTRQLREEVLTGNNVSAEIAVTPANAIRNRLVAALRQLDQQQPQEGWGRFVDGSGNLQWPLIRVGGHSGGGGAAVYISKQSQVDRACFFASPADSTNNPQRAAPWVGVSGATSNTRLYGFTHVQDAIVPYTLVQQQWTALQLGSLGAIVSVDGAAPPYGGSHTLTTSAPRPNVLTSSFHNITIVDVATPTDTNNLPSYRRAWQYLCFVP